MNPHDLGAVASWVLGNSHAGFPAAFAQFAHLASSVSPAAARVVINAMWQGAAVAFVLFLSLRLAPRVSAAHRFAAWAASFALVAALPFAPLAAHLFAGAAGAAPVSAVSSSPRPWLELDSRWALAIAALWLAGSALRLGDLILHTLRVRSLWKSATPVADDAANQALAIHNGGSRGLQAPEIAQYREGAFRPGVVLKGHGFSRADGVNKTGGALAPEGRPFEICTTRRLDHPSVIGFFSPRILIPEWLYARLTPQELSQVVLHEMEHLCRHDDWTNLIQKLLLVLFPLNPALAWIERRLCREREMACDEGVVRRTQAPRAYAACLASLAERGIERDRARELARRAEALSLAAWRRRPELVHRVHGILSRKPALSPAAARVLLAAVGCTLLAGSVELARCPQVVAFVAAPPQQQIAEADAVNIDLAAYTPVSAPQLASRYHIVQAKAILPSNRNQATFSAPAQPHDKATARPAATMESQIASCDAGCATPRESLLRSEMTGATGDRDQTSDAPQFVVFTAVERVQALPRNSREFADYDTGALASQQPATPRQTVTENSKQIWDAPPQVVVTRLILRIETAPTDYGQAGSSEQSSPTKSLTDSKSVNSAPVRSAPVHQPALIPFGNGWLVLQL